jgi:hypothetical protein
MKSLFAIIFIYFAIDSIVASVRAKSHFIERLSNETSIFNVKDCGAKGDGSTDDTLSIVTCLKGASEMNGVLYFPSGRYLITKTIFVPESNPLQIHGDGWTSIILWSFNNHLFSWNSLVSNLFIEDLKILSTRVNKNKENAAFIFNQGTSQSIIKNLLITNNDSNSILGSGIKMLGITDTITIRDCFLWGIKGTGIEIGHGSEVRIFGGRIIGYSRNDGSIGVLVSGNNGGVHIDSTDIISLNQAIVLQDLYGFGSNREIFITQATLDSCGTGLAVFDSSYVSIAGCWAASSDQNQIWTAPGENLNPILVIVGGTIFNGGIYECNDPNTQCNGITINSGRFTLSAVEIRNNKGKGIWIPNENVYDYNINGCTIFQNGLGLNVTGSNYLVSGNICSNNNSPKNVFKGNGFVQGNVGC